MEQTVADIALDLESDEQQKTSTKNNQPEAQLLLRRLPFECIIWLKTKIGASWYWTVGGVSEWLLYGASAQKGYY